jgi:hypothetical protein
MDYWICEADDPKKLREQVNLHMNKGWRPLGGLSVAQSHNTSAWWYYQAMILPDPDSVQVEDWETASQ